MAVTTTDLGKIMLTNGGEYNPDTTYEKMTFVLYQNSTYLALQTVTGIEPSDDRVNWQLMAKGFAGSETQIEGYVFVDNEEVIAPESDPALDADKLGGQAADYYAPQHEISDSFSESKSYALGDYCIYLNALYRFTKAKEAGAWDGTAVVPVTLAQEIAANRDGIATINSNFHSLEGCRFTQGLVNDGNVVQMQVNTIGIEKSKGLNFQVNLNTGEYRVSHEKDGSWSAGSALALKGDLIGSYYILTVEGHNLNYAANEEKVDTFSVSGVPSTYRAIAVVDVYSGSPRINVGNRFFEYDKKTITASTKNMSSDTLSAYVYARVLCERL